MSQRLLPAASLLLVVLLFPAGSSGAPSDSFSVIMPSGGPEEEYPGKGANGPVLLRHRAKRYLPARTPPFPEPEPDFKIINCEKSDGKCQEYCNFMEVQVGYCSKKKDPCCLRPA